MNGRKARKLREQVGGIELVHKRLYERMTLSIKSVRQTIFCISSGRRKYKQLKKESK